MSITFKKYLREERVNKAGEAPIMIRVTINRKSIPRKTDFRVPIKMWDAESQQVISKHPNAKLINAALDKKIQEIKAELIKEELNDRVITKDMVLNKLKGTRKEGFFDYCEKLISERWQGKKKASTLEKYTHELSKIRKYSPTLDFPDITPRWLEEYEAYQRIKLHNQQNTLWRSFKHIKTFLRSAIKDQIIKEYPFDRYDTPTYKAPIRERLTSRELDRFISVLQNHQVSGADLAAGWFYVFSCYTGLRYSDCWQFNRTQHNVNGRIYLNMIKTEEDVSILVTDKIRQALIMIEPYEGKMPTNQECNRAVKAICKAAEIKKRPTFHSARHYFGFSCAEKNVPIEVTAKLMGHRNPKVTAVYYHISNRNVDEWMKKLHE